MSKIKLDTELEKYKETNNAINLALKNGLITADQFVKICEELTEKTLNKHPLDNKDKA